jgi:hypothetical protein
MDNLPTIIIITLIVVSLFFLIWYFLLRDNTDTTDDAADDTTDDTTDDTADDTADDAADDAADDTTDDTADDEDSLDWYLKVSLNGHNKILHMSEIQVFNNNGINIAKGQPTNISSTKNQWIASNAVDNDLFTLAHTNDASTTNKINPSFR